MVPSVRAGGSPRAGRWVGTAAFLPRCGRTAVLGTCFWPFDHTSGPFPDLIGSELNLPSGWAGLPPAPRTAPGCTPLWPRRDRRGAGRGVSVGRAPSPGLPRPRWASGRAAPGGAPGAGAGARALARAAGARPVACPVWPGGLPEGVRLGLAGRAGRPALGAGTGARPGRFQFSPRPLVTV